MTSTNLISNQSSPAASFVGSGHSELGPAMNPETPEQAACRSNIDRVVKQIEAPEVRVIIGTVFQDLLRLLECLSLIESHLGQVDAAQETFAFFQLIHDDACTLVDYIRTDGLDCQLMTEELTDTLDGIAFAVNHDLRRVFETESIGPPANKEAHVVAGKLYRAHDVLTNCLQQSTITLAIVFDPELAGARLFNSSDMRYRQSLQLCQDLSKLIELVETSEEKKMEPTLTRLAAGIETFRNDSMEFLMYSDWPQFESFCERITLSTTDVQELESVLHQFRCYLETLLGQVRMRAVLANVFPVQFGEEAHGPLPMTVADDSQLSSATFAPHDDGPGWRAFAFAV
jgi:hypothetical protein